MTTGTEGNDNLASDPGVDIEVVNALGGNDIITTLRPNNALGGATSITVNGGLGRDTLVIRLNEDIGDAWGALSGSGNDGSAALLINPELSYTISWTSIERLEIIGALYRGDYTTGDSVDIVRLNSGLGGTLNTGGGNDEIYLWGDPAQGGRFSIDGGAGHDIIDFTRVTSPRAEGWLAFGGDGNDSFVGTAFDDRFHGGSGNDLMELRGGVDQADGGSGFDSLAADLSLATADIFIDLVNGLDLSNGGYFGPAGTNFVNFEYFGGSGFRTGQGNDIVVTGVGERGDTVALGAGNDTATFTNGFDTVYGGNIDAGATDSGFDTLVLDWSLATAVRLVGLIQTNEAGASGQYTDGFTRRLTFQAIDRFVITTGTANDNIVTAGGNDEIRTGAGGDIIVANGGDDLIDGGAGADQMNGGAGNDFYFVEDAADFIGEGAGAGTDTVSTDLLVYTLAANVEYLIGTRSTGQALTGNGSANVITGSAGNDFIDGGAGADQLEGRLGDDIYVVGAGDTVVEAGGAGTDEVRTALAAYTLGANLEHLTGTSASGQALTGNDAANVVTGGGGNDTLDGGAGADQLGGGLGNDIYLVGAGDTVVEAEDEGTDEARTALAAYTLGAHVEKLTGTSASGQALTGNGLANTVAGGAGNDVIDGGAGSDQLAGGLGNDLYFVDSGDIVTEAANAGADEVRTALAAYTLAANVETLTGTSAAGQALTGNAGDNVVTGGAGNDLVAGGAGADQLAGGLGDDVYNIDAADTVTEAQGAGTDEIRTALATYALGANLENLTGTSAAGQTLTGNELANLITGGNGNDVLDGGAAADQLAGGLGNDLYYAGAGDLVVEAASAGLDEVRTVLAAYSLAANVEKLTGLADSGQALTGNELANTVAGGSGDDVLDGGAGSDQLAGGLGNDRYVIDSGDTVAEAADAGIDEVSTALADYTLAFANVENLTGTSASGQALTGNGGDNVVTGGAGDDVLDGAAGADQLAGGLGDDVYLIDSADTVVEAQNAGTDEVRTSLAAYALGAELEVLTGTSAAGQSLTGNALANVLNGGAGNDVLDGGAAADQLAGGLGDDVYYVDLGDSVIEEAGAGTDEVRTALASHGLAANVEKLTGTSNGGQALTGNGLANVITGGSGNDLLDGGEGADQLGGGLGDDIYVIDADDLVSEAAASGTDEIRTSLATVSLAAYANFENLTGTSASGQTLIATAGDNVVTGGAGNDVLRMDGGGDDTANGGGGNDNIFFIGALTSADVVNGGAGVDTLVVQGPYGSLTLTANLTQIENVSILAGSNTSFGEPGTNRYDYVLTTNDANFAAGVQARINGAALLEGEDFTFDGSAETDASYVVYGGKGKDTLLGGLGNDIFFYAEERFASGDTVNGGAGYDGMFLRGNYTIDFNAPGYTGLFTNIENLTLTSATDERYARGGGTEFDYNLTLSDAIVGAGQELTVSGALLKVNEWMVLDGSQETDGRLRLFGGAGADTLKGGASIDYIHGALGSDILSGGGGADTFRYQNVLESNAPSRDHIIDFTPGTDRIELERIDANAAAGGNQAFAWIGTDAFSQSAGQLRGYQSGDNWIVEGDINGDGFADLVIALTLQGPTPLSAGDFFL